ncbi:MAG: DNA polymerase subunit beta [Methanobacterium sp.]|nr:MAG: DNA polymerase subunit beta [Methanobacterium sp.]
MMKARPRDFIYTTDDLYFATTSYLHPEDRILSFLRYIPHKNGDRLKNGKKYAKVDSVQAYNYLQENYPDYLFECENSQTLMMGVPLDRVKEILTPHDRLKEIMKEDQSIPLLRKVVKVGETFHEKANIPYENMGISGSILPGLYNIESSDIDFVIYGLENHRRARATFKDIKDQDIFQSIGDDYWDKIFKKRIKDSALSFEEFCWYEKRKNNRGIIDGTLFDILATRNWEEIKGSWGDIRYENHGHVTLEATVKSALASFDNPAVYEVNDVKIMEGPPVTVDKVASFTHTYAGQAEEDERIIVKGKLERVIDSKNSYRVVVGTTRESIDEFIKIKDLHMD